MVSRQGLARPQALRQVPERFVEPHVLVQSFDGPGLAEEAAGIARAATAILLLAAVHHVFLHDVEHVPERGPGVLAAAVGEDLLRSHGCFLQGVVLEDQSGFPERPMLDRGKLASLVALQEVGNSGHLAHDAKTRLNDLGGLEVDVHDRDAREHRIREDHPVAAHEAKDACVQVVGAGAVVAVDQYKLGPLSLRAGEVVHPRKADEVLLKALAVGVADALLLGEDGCPALAAQPVDHVDRGNEGIPVGDFGVGVAREHAGCQGAELLIVDLVVAC